MVSSVARLTLLTVARLLLDLPIWTRFVSRDPSVAFRDTSCMSPIKWLFCRFHCCSLWLARPIYMYAPAPIAFLLRLLLNTVFSITCSLDPYIFLLIILRIQCGFAILIKIQFPKRAYHTNAEIQCRILVLPLGISGLAWVTAQPPNTHPNREGISKQKTVSCVHQHPQHHWFMQDSERRRRYCTTTPVCSCDAANPRFAPAPGGGSWHIKAVTVLVTAGADMHDQRDFGYRAVHIARPVMGTTRSFSCWWKVCCSYFFFGGFEWIWEEIMRKLCAWVAIHYTTPNIAHLPFENFQLMLRGRDCSPVRCSTPFTFKEQNPLGSKYDSSWNRRLVNSKLTYVCANWSRSSFRLSVKNSLLVWTGRWIWSAASTGTAVLVQIANPNSVTSLCSRFK